MSKLAWARLPGDTAELASGDICFYLVIGNPGAVTLTRVRSRPNMSAVEAAVLAARNSISIHPKAAGAAAPFGSDLGHARKMAQQYEDGETFFGHPAWQHEED